MTTQRRAFSFRKVGGIRFIRLGRLNISVSMARKRPKERVEAPVEDSPYDPGMAMWPIMLAMLALSGCSGQASPIARYAPEPVTAQVTWLELWADPVLIHDQAPQPIPLRGFDEQGKQFFLSDGAVYYGDNRT